MGRKYSVEDITISKFKDKLWEDKELEDKRKLRYYKEVINPTFDNENDLFVLSNNKRKMNITEIRNNSHELESQIGCWTRPKMP